METNCCKCVSSGVCIRCTCARGGKLCRNCVPGQHNRCKNKSSQGQTTVRPHVDTSTNTISSNTQYNDTDHNIGITHNGKLCPECKTTTESTLIIHCENCQSQYHETCLINSQLNKTERQKWYCNQCYISHLPEFQPDTKIDKAKWGILKGHEISNVLREAHSSVITWKRNLFKIPTDKTGKSFVEEMTTILKYYTNRTNLESVSLKALMVIGPLLLQKPGKNSKNNEHIALLKARLEKWRTGRIKDLIAEGKAIQKRLERSKHNPIEHKKIFTRLMLQGKVGAALKWIAENRSGLIPITPSVIEILKEKHPSSAPPTKACLDQLNTTTPPSVEPVIFNNIDEESIYRAAKYTKGSAGPSGMDSDAWRRILCSKSFGGASKDLCYAVALLARRLCTEFVDPYSIEDLIACRLIPLDKNHGQGIRPIGIGEVLRRIIGRSITTLLKPDVVNAVGPLQLSAGQEGGCEAAVHAMRAMYEDDDSEGALFVDASNAFNSLNRIESLLQIRYICPEFSTFLINTYRIPAKLYISGSKGNFIYSEEGTTQGDNTASSFYSLGVTPLVKELASTSCRQLWYADDAAAGDTIEKLRTWWDTLNAKGPQLGYFPNADKTWLIVKSHFHDKAKDAFEGTGVKISTNGQKYLGSPIGTDQFVESFVSDKVDRWTKELLELVDISKREPQLAYAAYIYGLSKRWLFLMRTTPNISNYIQPLESCITLHFIPTLIDRFQPSTHRRLFSLPAKLGGLGIFDPTEVADRENEYSIKATASMVQSIFNQEPTYTRTPTHTNSSNTVKQAIKLEKATRNREEFDSLSNSSDEVTRRGLELLVEKGASSWLTSLPIQNLGAILNKQEFKDALCLRYNLPVPGMPKFCSCGKANNVNHALICMRGGYSAMRHDHLRNTVAGLLSEVCKDVVTEPHLIHDPSGRLGENARLDISARGVWSGLDRTFVDVRVFHPGADSYVNSTPESIYKRHENEKKTKYLRHVTEVEKATFTPLVFSTSGGQGPEATLFHKKLASLIAKKRNILYSEAIFYVRRRIRFSILRTTLISIRGYRGRPALPASDVEDIDLNLIPTARAYDQLV